MTLILVGKPDFAGEISREFTDATFIELDERIFPDGEVCPRLVISSPNKFQDSHVIIALQLKADQNINNYFISLLWTVYNIKQYNPSRISCVVPYHIYSRQDRESRVGEPISLYFLAKTLESAGINDFITINSHIFGKMQIANIFQKASAVDISAIGFLSQGLRAYLSVPEELVCLSPDEGALLLAEEAAQTLGTPYFGAIHKKRDPNTGKISQSLLGVDLDIQGRDFLIIDDLVSSGGTMIGAAEILFSKGAKNVYFMYVHPVHSPENFKKMLKAGPQLIVSSDTIKTKFEGLTVVSIIPLIIEWIKQNHSRK